MHAKQIVFTLSAACLTVCAFGSARNAVADLLWSQSRLNDSTWLVPDHAGAMLKRAAPGELERAAAVAPARSAAMIELALAAESRGDIVAARRHLEEALRRDATFRPRWATINFLMRPSDMPGVLSHSTAAAAIYEGDLTALFDLCLRTGATPDRIYRSIVPLRPKAQREYLHLLVQRHRQLDAMPAALRLADLAHPSDRELLFYVCDQLLLAGAGTQAAQLWKVLPRFSSDAAGRCLDWKRQTVDGIAIIEAGESVVRLELSGRQPASVTVLRRVAVVEPGRRYHLRTVTSAAESKEKAIEWRWNGVAVGTAGSGDIAVKATRHISELELVIRRLPGERSAEGSLEITDIRLVAKPDGPAAGPVGR